MTENNGGLVVAGVNFRKTSLEIRNIFALSTDTIRKIYLNAEHNSPDDFFILSTCNRTEIYSTTNQPETLLTLLSSANRFDSKETENNIFIKSGDEAVKHLFRVASGLDSQIIGDYEIIGQLKNAFTLAKSHRRTSGYIEKLVNLSLQASRKIKKKTSLSDGTTSVSYAVIQLLKQSVNKEESLNICLIGLGKMGTITLKNLKNYLPQHNITVINRNESKAQEAANKHQVEYAPYTGQYEAIKNSTVLIVATGAEGPIIFKKDILSTDVKIIFDLSVPSNVSPDIKNLSGVKLYNIDELSKVINQTIEKRKNEIPLAEKIIDEHFGEFKQWENRRNTIISSQR